MSGVGIFIDGDNFFWVQKYNLNWDVDMARLIDFVTKRYGKPDVAKYYMSIAPDEESQTRRRGLRSALATMGYSVEVRKRKEIRQSVSGSVNEENGHRFKNDVDVVLALDVHNHMSQLDTIILVTGDSDFLRLLEIAETQRKQMVIMCTQGAISSELREKAGMNYIDLQDVKEEIVREN